MLMTPPVTEKQIVARLERLPASRWQLKVRTIVGTATFFDAFDALAIALALPALIGLWHLTPPEIGFLISSGYVGQIIGALAFGAIAERFGRIRALTACVALISVFSLASAFAWSYQSLLVLRFIQGLGLGGEVPLAAAYISELAKANSRGRFVGLYENVFTVGLLVASLVSIWIVPHLGWQWMFIIGAAPAVLVFWLVRAVPESPRWLAGKGRLAEAGATLDRIESLVTEGDVSKLPPLPEPLPEVVAHGSDPWGIFRGRYLGRTFVVWALWFFAALISYTLTVWLPSIYRTVFNLPVQDALVANLLTAVAGLCGGLTVAFVIDRIGRRAWFTTAFIGSALPLLWLGTHGSTLTVDMVKYLCMICSYFSSSMLLALYIYTPEIYPTRNRAVGTSIATAWQRVGTIVGPLFVSFALPGYGLGAVFLVFAGAAILAALTVIFFVDETRLRVLEEVSP